MTERDNDGPMSLSTSPLADIGVIGLAVMGRNLALNIVDHGFSVAVHDRDAVLLAEFAASGVASSAHDDLSSFVAALAPPRRILLMIRAGSPVDEVLTGLLPLLDAGDVVIDGGNSQFQDTERRVALTAASGVHFVGAGVSGGEEGARRGPAIMPGGAVSGWSTVAPILQSIAAVADDGVPCCDWMGSGGAGHFVKMVHNGIEYADMQLISETYALLLASGRSHVEMSRVFADWASGRLRSYLVEITSHILAHTDSDGSPLVEHILDVAGQKGTGRWSVVAGLDLGEPVSLIAEAVFARNLSAAKDERLVAAQIYGSPTSMPEVSVSDLEEALFAAKLVSYAQGFATLRAASEHHGWHLRLERIASVWRAGCIIRAAFLDDVARVLADEPLLPNLLLAPRFADELRRCVPGWRRVTTAALASGIAVPGLTAALSFFDAYRTAHSAANLLQAQRDYFGAHTYERTDRARGEFFHTDWTGIGSGTAFGGSEA